MFKPLLYQKYWSKWSKEQCLKIWQESSELLRQFYFVNKARSSATSWIARVSPHYAVQGHSRSPISAQVENRDWNPRPGETRSFWQTRKPDLSRPVNPGFGFVFSGYNQYIIITYRVMISAFLTYQLQTDPTDFSVVCGHRQPRTQRLVLSVRVRAQLLQQCRSMALGWLCAMNKSRGASACWECTLSPTKPSAANARYDTTVRGASSHRRNNRRDRGRLIPNFRLRGLTMYVYPPTSWP